MILNQKPLHLAEVREIMKGEEENKQMQSYLKKFTKLTKEKADKLAEEIRALGNLKIKEENIVKIVDLLPEDAESLNKIFTDVSLSEDETNKILEIVKKY
jgi:DNA-directed RNA polymerase subunit F